MDYESLLEPYDGIVYTSRNSTERSQLANSIVAAFLARPESSMRVNHDLTPYSMDDLYDGLRNVCKKKALRRNVAVHKRDGYLVIKKLRIKQA